jgi:S1-C subfamily serine protease
MLVALAAASTILAASAVAQTAAPGDIPPVLVALEAAVTDSVARGEASVVAITRVRNPNGPETLAIKGRRPAPMARPDAFIEEPEVGNPDYLPLPGDFGSGIVIGDGGTILTAFHVVQGATRIYVRAPGSAGFDAEILAADPRSDLAVIVPRLPQGMPAPKLSALPIGRAEALRKGAFLIALGNPYHAARDGRASASLGILSNTTRRIVPPADASRPEVLQMFRYQPTLLQLDAKLNLGMSGGAVVDLAGKLVGLTTNGGNAEGYDAQAGYAIPLDEMGRRIVETLRQGHEVEYGFLGIKLDILQPNAVGGVLPGTPAMEGGLIQGDLITAVNDMPVDAESGLSLALSRAEVGKPARLTILRGNQTLEKSVFVSKYPIAGEVIATNRVGQWRGLRVDYSSVLGGTTQSNAVLDAMARGSVAVVEVDPNGPAAASNVKRGTIITKAAGQVVRTPAEFEAAVKGKDGPVVLDTTEGAVTVRP